MSQHTTRWYIKKTARATVMLGSWATGMLSLRGAFADRARVLTYHRIGNDRHDPFCVAPQDFEKQVRLLADQKRAVTLDQLLAFVAGRAKLPPDACLVTIDDGMLSTFTEALPILSRWGVPAVAFLSSNLIGRQFSGMQERYMTWDEAREVAASNVISIGSHAHTHRSLGSLSAREARDEARQSREMLQQELGREIRSFAYPFGTRGDFNDNTEKALADAGFTIAFHSMHGAIKSGMNPMSLPRVKVEGGESVFQFSLISRGGMDPWRAVDSNLWRLQRTRVEIE